MSDGQKFHSRLPRNHREFAAFLLVVSLVSVNIIPPVIMASSGGLTLAIYRQMLTVLPVLWLAVIAVVLATYRPAKWLKARFCCPDSSYNTHILIETLASVFLMSMVLTIVGTWIGTRHVTMEPIQEFYRLWPRNFAIAFLVESLIAQPLARFLTSRYHRRIDLRSASFDKAIEHMELVLHWRDSESITTVPISRQSSHNALIRQLLKVS